jgi:hypothetical protein
MPAEASAALSVLERAHSDVHCGHGEAQEADGPSRSSLPGTALLPTSPRTAAPTVAGPATATAWQLAAAQRCNRASDMADLLPNEPPRTRIACPDLCTSAQPGCCVAPHICQVPLDATEAGSRAADTPVLASLPLLQDAALAPVVSRAHMSGQQSNRRRLRNSPLPTLLPLNDPDAGGPLEQRVQGRTPACPSQPSVHVCSTIVDLTADEDCSPPKRLCMAQDAAVREAAAVTAAENEQPAGAGAQHLAGAGSLAGGAVHRISPWPTPPHVDSPQQRDPPELAQCMQDVQQGMLAAAPHIISSQLALWCLEAVL